MQQICDFHLRFIRYICTENNCMNKLLCDDCHKQSTEHAQHKVVEATQFLTVAENFLKGGMPEFVLHGQDLQSKTKSFQQITSSIRSDLRTNNMRKVEELIDKYMHQIIDDLMASKKMVIEFISHSIDECFSPQILSNRESAYIIIKQVLAALNAKISTREGSHLLFRLHNGELEKEYYEKKIQALIELFSHQIKYTLEPFANKVQKYMKQFYNEMEKLKQSVKEEHFQINKTNMLPKQFKIKDLQINQNLQLKLPTPQYTKIPITSKLYTEEGYEPHEEVEINLKPLKVSKQQKMELIKSLDYTHHTSRIQSHSNQIQQQLPQIAQYDPSGADFKKIIQVSVQHTYLIKVIHLFRNVCMSVGKEGTINVFTIEIEGSDLSIVNQHQLKPHQEIKDVELCQTPGMFLTTGRNIRVINEKYVDLGYTVKLYLFQDINLIELLTEFRDLHQSSIEQLKFINESYLRQKIEFSKYSNELEFATISFEYLKVWKFSYDSSKIYDGEMQEMFKIDLRGSQIRSVDFESGMGLVSDRLVTYLYNSNQLSKQLKVVSGKDTVLRSKLITGRRLIILTVQGLVVVVDLQKITQTQVLTNLKEKPYEPLKINLKKYLRGILFEKEEKELELVDVIQVKQKFIAMLHSSQYDHFLLLNKQFDLENKFRFPPGEIRYLKLLDIDQHQLMIALDGKSEYQIWDVSK